MDVMEDLQEESLCQLVGIDLEAKVRELMGFKTPPKKEAKSIFKRQDGSEPGEQKFTKNPNDEQCTPNFKGSEDKNDKPSPPSEAALRCSETVKLPEDIDAVIDSLAVEFRRRMRSCQETRSALATALTEPQQPQPEYQDELFAATSARSHRSSSSLSSFLEVTGQFKMNRSQSSTPVRTTSSCTMRMMLTRV